MEKSYIPW